MMFDVMMLFRHKRSTGVATAGSLDEKVRVRMKKENAINIATHQVLEQLWIIALTDFKLRYANSVLGYVWSLFKPLVIFLVLYVVFSFLMRLDIVHYQLHLLLGIIIWNFFAESTLVGLHSFVTKAHLVTKLNIRRWIVVVASSITSLMTLLLNLIVFYIFLLFSTVTIRLPALTFIFIVCSLYFLTVGLSLALSVLMVKFRDVIHIWELILQMGFFLSPVIYPIEMIPIKYRIYFFVNPLTPIIQYSRQVFIVGEWPDVIGLGIAFAQILCIFFAGVFLFNKMQSRIAEYL
jgi:lipopolysaccharide transport system permease protein